MDFMDHLNKPVPGFSEPKVSRRPAGFWKRTFAFITDIILFNILIASSFSALFPQASLSDQLSGGVTSSMVGLALVIISFFFCYLTGLQYLTGQTIGMVAFGLRVSPSSSFWRIALRNIFVFTGVFPVLPLIILCIVDPICLFVNGARLSDTLSSTYVEEI